MARGRELDIVPFSSTYLFSCYAEPIRSFCHVEYIVSRGVGLGCSCSEWIFFSIPGGMACQWNNRTRPISNLIYTITKYFKWKENILCEMNETTQRREHARIRLVLLTVQLSLNLPVGDTLLFVHICCCGCTTISVLSQVVVSVLRVKNWTLLVL